MLDVYWVCGIVISLLRSSEDNAETMLFVCCPLIPLTKGMWKVGWNECCWGARHPLWSSKCCPVKCIQFYICENEIWFVYIGVTIQLTWFVDSVKSLYNDIPLLYGSFHSLQSYIPLDTLCMGLLTVPRVVCPWTHFVWIFSLSLELYAFGHILYGSFDSPQSYVPLDTCGVQESAGATVLRFIFKACIHKAP